MGTDPGYQKEADILIVGAGILGVTLAYWLSSLYDCKIVLVDMEQGPAKHTTTRNTGVIHRPFYLDPRKKRIFARTAGVSYPLWRELAKTYGLPWKPVGTLNVALRDDEIRTLEKYEAWGVQNGMEELELELLEGGAVRVMQPEVNCKAALLSKTDVSVDFAEFARLLQRLSHRQGAVFLRGAKVESMSRANGGMTEVAIMKEGVRSSVRCKFLVNAAGGGALAIAHASGLAETYSVLHFRGDYWVVDEPFASKVGMNVYRPPRDPQFPFLDPHLVVRADGSREIGPNAALVTGPYAYGGIGLSTASSLLAGPIVPKLKLLRDPAFLTLLAREWRSSLSKRAMCARVREFVPALQARMLNRRAVFGIRSSVVGDEGFVPEALLIKDEHSVHIINYNSPGATGAPAYSAMLVEELRRRGQLDGFRKKEASSDASWDFEQVVGAL